MAGRPLCERSYWGQCTVLFTYLGIPKTRLPQGTAELFLATHTSTSCDSDVAKGFAKWHDGDAMLIKIHSTKASSANMDVSWLSKFPGEEETLFNGNGQKFYIKSIEDDASDDPEGPNQIVVLEDEYVHMKRDKAEHGGKPMARLQDWKTIMDEEVEQGMMSPEERDVMLLMLKRQGYR